MLTIYYNKNAVVTFDKGGDINAVARILDRFCDETLIKHVVCLTLHYNGGFVNLTFRPHIYANEEYILQALVKIGAMDVIAESWYKGYISRKLEIGEIYSYSGRYGNGYIMHYASWKSTRYHRVKYFTWK